MRDQHSVCTTGKRKAHCMCRSEGCGAGLCENTGKVKKKELCSCGAKGCGGSLCLTTRKQKQYCVCGAEGCGKSICPTTGKDVPHCVCGAKNCGKSLCVFTKRQKHQCQCGAKGCGKSLCVVTKAYRPQCACGAVGCGSDLYNRHIRGTNTRGINNELSEERYRWLVNQPCLYCGRKATGVDRVKNTHGYTVYNSVPCCKVCNYMKSTMEARELLAQAALIAAQHSDHASFKRLWIAIRSTPCPSSSSSAKGAKGQSNSSSSTTKGRKTVPAAVRSKKSNGARPRTLALGNLGKLED